MVMVILEQEGLKNKKLNKIICFASPLHYTCLKVFKNTRYVKYLIRIRFLLREGETHPPSKPTKFLDVQANRVNKG